MYLNNFTSIFEIYFTIYLAYTITDNFSESNFISMITEKILRKYQEISNLFSQIDEKIIGCETSLNNIELPKIKPDSTNVEEEAKIKYLKSQKSVLDNIKERIKQNKKEIESVVKDSYQTKSFSYISLYLSFYSIIILIFAGVETSLSKSGYYNSLLFFILASLSFLYFAWQFDVTLMDSKNQSRSNKFVLWFSNFFKIENGYKFTINLFFIIFLFTIGVYLLSSVLNRILVSISFYLVFQNGIVIFSVFIPILNFYIYFRKASKRAEKIKAELTLKVRAIAEDVPVDLKEIEEAITFAKVSRKIEIKNISKN